MNQTTPSPRLKIPLVVGGAMAALVAAVLLAVGGLALWADGKKDDHGYLSTSSHRFSAPTAALATDNIDLDGTKWLADHYGKVQLRVAPQTGKPVFVGIARTRDVTAYLGGTAHTNVTDLDYSPPFDDSFDVTYRNHPGARRATPPADRHIWAASAQGDATQTLDWHAREGNWSVVVMNADGSPGVQASIKAGAKVPFLAAAGWTSLGGGVLLLVSAAGLFVLAGRRPRPAHQATVAAPAV